VKIKFSHLLNSFTLKQIAEECGIENIRTARHYLNQLPKSHRQGQGRYAKYTRKTLNCFLLLNRLKTETPLRIEQIAGVLRSLPQDQIDRIVSGAEPLEIGFAIKDGKGRYKLPDEGSGKGHSRALLVDGDKVRPVEVLDKGALETAPEAPMSEAWKEIQVTPRIQVRYQGKLSTSQIQELKIASRILKTIVER